MGHGAPGDSVDEILFGGRQRLASVIERADGGRRRVVEVVFWSTIVLLIVGGLSTRCSGPGGVSIDVGHHRRLAGSS